MKILKYLATIALSAVIGMSVSGCSDDPQQEEGTPVDKAVLSTELTSAKALLSGAVQGEQPGQYPQTAMTAFTSAIADAQTVYDNEQSSQIAVDGAVIKLKAAVKTFKAAVVVSPVIDKSALLTALNEANAKINAAVEGTAKGEYTKTVIDAFQAKIDEAQGVYDNAAATQAAVNQTVTDLKAAQTTFLNSANAGNPVDTSLSLYLTFDGSATDASSYEHAVVFMQGETGQPEPSLTTDRLGAPDKAYKFEGGFMSIPNHETLNPSTMSVMFWMCQSALSATDTAPLSLGWWDCYMAKIIGGAEQNEIAFVAGIGTSVMSGVMVNPGQWYHVAITRSATELAIYIDGELKNIQEAASPMNRNEVEPLRIGVLSENGGYYYPYFGNLDEIRIYNKPLTGEEVLAIYDEERP